MQFVAHISQEGTQRNQSFWHDVAETDDWLARLGKEVVHRHLTVRARSLRQVTPWDSVINQPIQLEGWLTPMAVGLTWRYLVEFLVPKGPDHLLIPVDADAHIEWDGHLLTIEAPRQSWLWRTIEEVWDPFSWPAINVEEWWEGHDPFLAQRFAWGFMLQTSPRPLWEQWQLSANRGHELVLQKLFTRLVSALGDRRMRVRWHQESLPAAELLLGLPIRLREITLRIADPDPRLWQRHHIGLMGLKAHMAWEIPRWSHQFANTLILRRWRHDSRLEAHYRVVDAVFGSEDSHRAFRQERHLLPIFTWYAVEQAPVSHSWPDTVGRAAIHQRLDQLATFMDSRPWPQLGVHDTLPTRLRFDRSLWRHDPIRSQPGVWVFLHESGAEVVVSWPKHEHPGHLAVRWAGIQTTHGIKILDPVGPSVKGAQGWRYWAWLTTHHAMPLVEEWARQNIEPD